MKLEGVYVALVSLFDEKGKLDFAQNANHIEWLCSQGISGLVPCGTTGESPTLTGEERKSLIQLSVEYGKKFSLPVVAGVGGNNTEKVLEGIEESADWGADAVLTVTPYYNKPTQAGLLAHYTYLADRSPLPIVLYNVPGRTGVNLAPETTLELLEHPKIVGLKEASGQHAQWLALAQSWKKNKSLLAGDDDGFATILGMGGSGIISASANVAPRQFVEIYNYGKNGGLKEAFLVQLKVNSLVKALFAETSPSPAKYALSLMRKTSPRVRLPLVELQPETQCLVKRALLKLELLS